MLSLKKDEELTLRASALGDTIDHILFCVTLLYADDNLSVSVTTRLQASEESDPNSTHVGDHDIGQDAGSRK